LGAFWTSPSLSIKAITGLIPIYLHIQKLNGRFHLRVHFLLVNHITKSLLEARSIDNSKAHWILLEWLMPKQKLNIKGSIMEIDNMFNKILSSFSPFNYKFLLENRLIDIFPSIIRPTYGFCCIGCQHKKSCHHLNSACSCSWWSNYQDDSSYSK